MAGSPHGGIVLDPFIGSGTTAQVAEKLGRKWIGIDINPSNKALFEERIAKTNSINGKKKQRQTELPVTPFVQKQYSLAL